MTHTSLVENLIETGEGRPATDEVVSNFSLKMSEPIVRESLLGSVGEVF